MKGEACFAMLWRAAFSHHVDLSQWLCDPHRQQPLRAPGATSALDEGNGTEGVNPKSSR